MATHRDTPSRWLAVRTNPIVQAVALWIVLTLLESLASGFLIPTSDPATVLLQANSILHHNVTLGGWTVPSDDFLLTTTLAYVPFVKLLGIDPVILRLVPPALYALAVTAFTFLAPQGLTRQGRIIAVLLVEFILGFPSTLGSFPPVAILFVEHTSTLAEIVIAWLLFRDAIDQTTGVRRRTSRWGIIACVVSLGMLALAIFDDPLTIFLFVLPVLLFRGINYVRSIETRMCMISAAWVLAATVLGEVGVLAIRHLGGFTEQLPLVRTLPLTHFPSTFSLYITYLFQVSGAYFWGGTIRSLHTVIGFFEAALLAVFVVSVCSTLVAWYRRKLTDDIAIISALAVVIMTATLFTSQYLTPGTQRYVMLLYCMGIPCMVRFIAHWHVNTTIRPVARNGAILAVVLASFLGFAPALEKPATNPYTPVVSFLESHHLTNGVGNYWDASIFTVESHGSTTVRPIYFLDSVHTLVIQSFLSDSQWYTDAPHADQWFAIWNQHNPEYGVTAATTTAAFGPPAWTEHVNGYVIAVWNSDIMNTVLANQKHAEELLHGEVPALPPS